MLFVQECMYKNPLEISEIDSTHQKRQKEVRKKS